MTRKQMKAVILCCVFALLPVRYANAEEISLESEKQFEPEGKLSGGYIESELDYNTPVPESMIQSFGILPQVYPEDMNSYNNKYPNVKDQNPYGTCWAFSSLGLAEYDLINDGIFTKENDLSELQLAYFTYNFVKDPLGGTEGDYAKYYNVNGYSSYLDHGGNYELAMRRLGQWSGAVNEFDVPYSNAYSTISAGLDENYAYDYDVAHLENAFAINIRQNPSGVKEQIMEHGAVGIMYYHLDSALAWSSTKSAYTYYDTSTAGGGHAVMIVGWDDSFSKDYFEGVNKPSNDGAWLVKNSWGSYCSYFWMSYDTTSLADSAWVFDFASKDNYDHNYQLDGGLLTYPSAYETMANVFTVPDYESDSCEELQAVSISSTRMADVSYTIDVYTDLSNSGDPTSGTKQETATTVGVTSYAGYYTIPLENSVILNPGTSFSIVVTVDKRALDCEEAISYKDFDNDVMLWECGVSLYNGKSFYKEGERFKVFTGGNLCVKAFTTNIEKQPVEEDNGQEPEEPKEPEGPKEPEEPSEPDAPENPKPVEGKWVQNSVGWWFRNPDGTYPYNCWKLIEEKWYYFNASGYRVTGWRLINGKWYYFDRDSGIMQNGWIHVGNACYYLKSNGEMAVGWLNLGGKWYYLNPRSGARVTKWIQSGRKWYYLDPKDGVMYANRWLNNTYYLKSNGEMAVGWLNLGGKWYYLNPGSGARVTNWIHLGRKWYYLDPKDGVMYANKWLNNTYYLKSNGEMAVGWLKIDGEWYYFRSNGSVARNCWVGNYYLEQDGKMATSKWVDNERYYVDVNGVWVPNKSK